MKKIALFVIGSILLMSCQKQDIKPEVKKEKYFIQIIMVDDSGQYVDTSIVTSLTN